MPSLTLVLGATGKSGRRLLPRLRLAGAEVRAASRSSEAAFDWADPGGWDAVLDGVEAVYAVPPAVPGPMHDFVGRAEAAGIRRVVLLSGHGADRWGRSDFGRSMRSAEEAVRASSLAWTVLRAANFNQNFDEENFHAPLLAGELALPAGDVPEPFVDLEDVADAAAMVLLQDGHAGRTYELTGARALTFAAAVDMIGRASGRSLRYRRISPEDYVATLVDQGLEEVGAREVAAMFELMDSGVLAAPSDDLAELLGRAPRAFEDYVVRAAAAGAWRV